MDHSDASELLRLLDELHTVVRHPNHDPSPHAPEIPYSLREALGPLFEAAGMVYPE